MSDIMAEIRDRNQAWRESWRDRLDDDGELYGSDLQCPHCGYVIDDLTDYSALLEEEGGDVECPSCDQTFGTCLYVSYSWTCKASPEGVR